MSRAIAERVDQDDQSDLRTNVGRTCFRYLQRLAQALRLAGYEVKFVAKTAGDRGKYVPPGFGQHQIRTRDGQEFITAVGVSHDVLYVNGRQTDCIVSAVYEDTNPAGYLAKPTFSDIPEHEWRNTNPPLPQGLEMLQVVGDDQPPVVVQPPAAAKPEFPPRNLVGDFFGALNARYRDGVPGKVPPDGRANRTSVPEGEQPREPLHIDNEGLFVWLSEFMRHYVEATGTTEARYAVAKAATLADIDRAWH